MFPRGYVDYQPAYAPVTSPASASTAPGYSPSRPQPPYPAYHTRSPSSSTNTLKRPVPDSPPSYGTSSGGGISSSTLLPQPQQGSGPPLIPSGPLGPSQHVPPPIQQQPQPQSQPQPQPESNNGLPPGTPTPAKKQSKWRPEENTLIVHLRGQGMKWEDISRQLPGRSAISCRLHYQNFLERRPEWDEERRCKLARLYERLKKDMWEKVAIEMEMPWRAVEAMHWELGKKGIADRAGVPVFSTASSAVMGQTASTNSPPASQSAVQNLPEQQHSFQQGIPSQQQQQNPLPTPVSAYPVSPAQPQPPSLGFTPANAPLANVQSGAQQHQQHYAQSSTLRPPQTRSRGSSSSSAPAPPGMNLGTSLGRRRASAARALAPARQAANKAPVDEQARVEEGAQEADSSEGGKKSEKLLTSPPPQQTSGQQEHASSSKDDEIAGPIKEEAKQRQAQSAREENEDEKSASASPPEELRPAKRKRAIEADEGPDLSPPARRSRSYLGGGPSQSPPMAPPPPIQITPPSLGGPTHSSPTTPTTPVRG